MIGVFNDLETTDASQTKLSCTKTGKAYLFPSGHVVRLGGSGNSFAVLLQMDMAQGKLGVVVDIDKQDLGRLVEAFAEAAITNGLDVGNVRAIDKNLQFSQIVNLGKTVNNLCVQHILLNGLTGHFEVGNELRPNFSLVCLGAHSYVLRRIFGIDKGLNSIGRHIFLELSLSKFGPNSLLIALLGIRLGAVELLQVVHKHSNCEHLHFQLIILVRSELRLTELSVDGKCFLI
mmetsp:Transcript_12361/g.18535  ORF Transcript_12361/g.18535 Transcript_12361/m.18535 type:complete len:232 (-) Transcript_12361:3284-3979(-)